ncbi:MAG: hypothetical protein ACRDT6_13080 [Micromonosporaceae bacterium]
MPAKTRAKPDTDAKILQALERVGPADAKTIANHCGVAYSTLTAKLRDLMMRGKATRDGNGNGRVLWRAAGIDKPANDTGDTPVGGHPEPATATTSAAAAPATAKKPATARQKPPKPSSESAKTGSKSAKTAGKAAAESRDRRSNGSVTASGTARRAKRQLRSEVLAFLRQNPDTAYKVSELSKALDGASSGAIANTCHKLVHSGEARQTVTAPATYQAV